MCMYYSLVDIYIIHVHDVEYYDMIVSIVLWYMLCDGFTYFSQSVGVTTTLPDWVPYILPLLDLTSGTTMANYYTTMDHPLSFLIFLLSMSCLLTKQWVF